tara:strand:+ start:38 stop:163 length:126 start_codon:yes stop_codon:yes gene_type:complete
MSLSRVVGEEVEVEGEGKGGEERDVEGGEGGVGGGLEKRVE